MQGRRRRYKVRSRRYVESDRYLFELKLKGRRGETVKHRLPYGPGEHGSVSDAARAFVEERLAHAYPRLELPELAPTVGTSYSRVTLANGAERVTCDFDLAFSDGDDRARTPRLDSRFVIVESKSERGYASADIALRRLGARPLACSKYCVGVGLLRDDVKVNDLRPLLDNYFVHGDA
jgi:hypothetical protein